MIRVTVSKDGDRVLQIALEKDDIIIGRGHEADVQLTSEAVSRRHARLQLVDGSWQVADLGAANGVYVSAGEKAEPERVVIRPLAMSDRIHIEAFVIELEELAEEDPEAAIRRLPTRDASSEGYDETSLETNRTQFISMVDVLAARQNQHTPTVTGPIMRFVSEEGGPTLEHEPIVSAPVDVLPAAPASASSSSSPPAASASSTETPAAQEAEKPAARAAVSSAAAPNAWVARMTSPSGHERNFPLTATRVNVGSAESCAVRLPSGPSVIVELERAGNEVSFRRVPLWPFPRVIVGGRSEKRGLLSDGESFIVGEYEVTLHLNRDA